MADLGELLLAGSPAGATLLIDGYHTPSSGTNLQHYDTIALVGDFPSSAALSVSGYNLAGTQSAPELPPLPTLGQLWPRGSHRQTGL
jgi:hypothetical protein